MDRIFEVSGLSRHFHIKSGPMKRETLRAVDGVDFNVESERVFSLVGESGCGKSTVARLLMRLLEPTAGRVLYRGRDVFKLRGEEFRKFRRSVQIVFQDPFASLNPRRRVFDTLAEPLKIHSLAKTGQEKRRRVAELLEDVGLKDVEGRYPHEFSGGQRQRICIARALAVSPEVIIADEPLSALDVSIQAQILNLLRKLKEEHRLSFVFISHDLRVVRYFSDRVAVMYLGRIVEEAPVEDLFDTPLHPYTEILLASVPQLRKREGRAAATPPPPGGGEVPSPIDIPGGCPFHTRCPRRFEPCSSYVPQLRKPEGTSADRKVACHLHNEPEPGTLSVGLQAAEL